MNPLTNYVYQQFIVYYAVSKGYVIDTGCADHIISGLSGQLGSYFQFTTDDIHPWNAFVVKNTVFAGVENNCHTYIGEMINVAAAESTIKVLHEWSFFKIKSLLCPLFPIC